MNILITGATGFLGQALVEDLLKKQNVYLKVAIRTVAQKVANVENFVIGDLSTDIDWSSALENTDVVIHSAARVHIMNDTSANPLNEFRKINVDATRLLVQQAVQSNVKHFIFISTVKVNGEDTNPAKPFLDSDMPNPSDPYAISKFEAEQLIIDLCKESNMHYTILRPVLMYGPNVKANFAKLIQLVKTRIPLPFLSIQNKRSILYVKNFSHLIQHCMLNTEAYNQVFLASDATDFSLSELVFAIGKAIDKPSKQFYFPQWLLESGLKLLGQDAFSKRLTGSLQVDVSRTQNVLSWQPPVTSIDAMRISFKK